jgi:hypothetical protein
VNRAKSRTNINKYWQGLFDVLAHVAPAQSDHIFAELANDLHSIETWPPRRRLQLARVLLRFDPQRATELIDQGRLSDKKEYLVDRVAVLAVTAPELAAELAERTLHEHDSLTADELAAALLGEPGLPGAPTLRPIAHDCVRAALADDTSWSYTLPQIAELEPQAVIAVFDRLQELNTIGR